MLGQPSWSPRTEYIVRHGILRRGVIVGALVTIVGVLPEAGEFDAHWHAARVALVMLVACAVWAVVAGWVIGAFLWSRQEAAADEDGGALATPTRRPSDPTPNGR